MIADESLLTRAEQQAAGKVLCQRCGREHWKITFTQEDHDDYVAEQAKQLALKIDEAAFDHVMSQLSEAK